MNLKSLNNEAMIVVASFLLDDSTARALLDGHELGRATANQLDYARHKMVQLVSRRVAAKVAIDQLTREMTDLDRTHDDSARALSHILHALIAWTSDPEMVEFCQHLLHVCLPNGLDLVNASYTDQAGWAKSVQTQVTPDMLARMDAIAFGADTLGAIYRVWIDAGVTLGHRLNERVRLQAALAKNGLAAPDINMTVVRSLWIRSMRAVLTAIALMNLTAAQRESLLAPIESAVAEAKRRRAGHSETQDEPDEPLDDAPGQPSDVDAIDPAAIDPAAIDPAAIDPAEQREAILSVSSASAAGAHSQPARILTEGGSRGRGSAAVN